MCTIIWLCLCVTFGYFFFLYFLCQCVFQYVILRLNLLQSMTATRRSQKANCEWQQQQLQQLAVLSVILANSALCYPYVIFFYVVAVVGFPPLFLFSYCYLPVLPCAKSSFNLFFMLHLSICARSGQSKKRQSFLCTNIEQ